MESACKLTVGRDHYDGKVRMEGDHIDFSGPTKFRFRISEMSEPYLEDLNVRFGFHGHPVIIELSSQRAADNWIAYILHPQSLAEKLGVKDGQSVRIMNLDDPDLVDSIQSRNARVVSRASARCDFVMLGVERSSELRQIEDLFDRVRPRGAVWVVLPKTGRTVTKANVSAAAREAGLNHEEVVDYSETQAAHKITRPAVTRRRGDGAGLDNGGGAARRTAAPRAAVKAK
jgi:hypothetical protein